jgi:hypothetical protein
MGQWDSEMRSAVAVRLLAKHTRTTATLMEVMRAAEKLAAESRPIARGVYEIKPESLLSLRTSLAAARQHMERISR